MMKEELHVGLRIRCVIDVRAYPYMAEAYGQIGTITAIDEARAYIQLQWDQPHLGIGTGWSEAHLYFEPVDPKDVHDPRRAEALDQKRRHEHAMKWL